MNNQAKNDLWHREPIAFRDLKWLLPGDEWQIVPNRVGNLAVLDPQGAYVGYITFAKDQDHCFVSDERY